MKNKKNNMPMDYIYANDTANKNKVNKNKKKTNNKKKEPSKK